MKKKIFILYISLSLVASFHFTAVPAVGAAAFPEKPITLVVHSGAGGGSDIFARTLAAGFDKNRFLPQPIIVENKPGGSGAIAFAYVAGKKNDPYYLLTAVVSLLTVPLIGTSPVTYKNFTPLANFSFDEYVVIARADSKYRSMKEVIADAKSSPKKVTIGGAQVGSADSICTYLIEKDAGVKFNYVVFNSGGAVNTAILGGHVDIAISNPSESLEFMKAGKMKVLGSFSERRLEAMPDIPTLKEQGINAIYVVNRGLAAPADIPKDARKTLEEGFHKYFESDVFKNYVRENMQTAVWMDGEKFGKWLDAENVRYAEILRDMGLIKKK